VTLGKGVQLTLGRGWSGHLENGRNYPRKGVQLTLGKGVELTPGTYFR